MKVRFSSARKAAGALAGFLSLAPFAARADVIDGNWCYTDGRHFTIKGREITTPGGQHTEGQYTRHSFSYVVPQSESGAGEIITMALLNETTVRLKSGSETQAAQIWRRCEEISRRHGPDELSRGLF